MIEPISTDLLTDTQIGGNGVLDKLLTTARTHLDREYMDQRITGKEYSNAYIELYTQSVQASIAYAIAAAKLPYEVALVEAQTKLADQQRELAYQEMISKLPMEVKLLESDVALKEFQIDTLLPKEAEQMDAQIALADKELQLKELELTQRLPAEIANLEKQGELMDSQIATAAQDLLLKAKQLEIAEKELLVKLEEIKVMEAQSELYAAKVITEKAQTDNTVVGTGSVIDSNNKLIQAQADAFEKEQVVKAVKLAMDTFSIGYNEGDRWGNATNLQNDNTLGMLMEKLGETIGLSLTHVHAPEQGGNIPVP